MKHFLLIIIISTCTFLSQAQEIKMYKTFGGVRFEMDTLVLRKLSVNTGVDDKFDIKDGLPGVEIQVLKVGHGSSLDGKTLADLDFRKKHGVTVLSVSRGSDLIYTPEGNFLLQAKDACILLGKPEDLCSIRRFFESVQG